MTHGLVDADKQTTVEITVNNRPVTMPGHTATGIEIKWAAIVQGVEIQLDFQLAHVRGNGERQIVGDADPVHLHEHERFVATASDDNS